MLPSYWRAEDDGPTATGIPVNLCTPILGVSVDANCAKSPNKTCLFTALTYQRERLAYPAVLRAAGRLLPKAYSLSLGGQIHFIHKHNFLVSTRPMSIDQHRSGNVQIGKIGRNDPCACGSGKKHKNCCGSKSDSQALSSRTSKMAIQTLLHGALLLHQRGQLAQAEANCQQILMVEPLQAEALHLLGLISHQLGKRDAAVDLIRRAAHARPGDQNFRYNLGYVLKEQGKLAEAATAYREALSIAADPDTLNNLGIVLREEGKIDEAVDCYRRALSLKPSFADAHNNLGNALNQLGRLEEASTCFRNAVLARPNYPEAHSNLGALLKQQGKPTEAIDCYLRALQLGNSSVAKTGFAQCIKDVTFTLVEPTIDAFIISAITEAWIRPAELWTPAMSLVRLNPTVNRCIQSANNSWPERLSMVELFGPTGLQDIAEERLLRSVLVNMPNMGMETERFLTMVRQILLDLALGEAVPDGQSASTPNMPGAQQLGFFCALARQCYINEYIFTLADSELGRVEQLRGLLVERISHGVDIPPIWLIAFAAYYPLNNLPDADVLLEKSWPEPLAALLTQQIEEPRTEHTYSLNMHQIGEVAEGVSRVVQAQYEENPYPRWIGTPLDTPSYTVDSYFNTLFPRSPFEPTGATQGVDILIAGCGTGQHSIQTARTFRGARLLAIDLSLASLGYAKRKTAELGLANIEYARADILKIGDLQQSFDIVESVGVLHHLADPVGGWRMLLGSVRQGGLMRLGLYSEVARQSVVASRHFIARNGYGSRASDIRQCRQDLTAPENSAQFTQLQLMGDFYVTSGCRDLLFHVQEHRFTLPQLKALLQELNLVLIGFVLEATTASQYQAQFPDDLPMLNLDNWHVFESANPDTFANMYQFWVQKVN